MQPIIIAIDGFSSCGKSTLAKALAKYLNYSYIDTGAMYRAVCLYFLRKNIDGIEMSENELDTILDKIHISFRFNKELGFSETFLNGENIEEEIRGKEVSDAVSQISQIKTIRKRMVSLQQRAGKNKGLVMDGRDIGSVVFPEAEVKLFMTAKPEIRAQRRFDELKAKGKEVTLQEIVENLALRDHNDTHRKENPLVQASDAIVVDNSNLNQEEQLKLVKDIVNKRLI